MRQSNTVGQFLIDLLLLRGRMRRLPFIGWTAASYIGFVGCALLAFEAPDLSPQSEASLALALLCIAIKFPVVSARLHDLNATALAGLAPLLIVVMGIYNHYLVGFLNFPDIPFFHDPAFGAASETTKGEVVGVILFIAVPLADLILMIVPGNRSRNRFGPPPGKDDITVAEQF